MTRYLIFLRPEAGKEMAPKALANAAEISRADAHRVLRSKIPEAIAVCRNTEEAKSRIRSLRENGLDGIVVSREAMLSFKPAPVLSAAKGEGGIFWNTKEEPVWLGTDDVRMIVVGKFHSKTETQDASRYKEPYDMLFSYGGGNSENRPPSDVKIIRRSATRFLLLFRGTNEAYLLRGDGFDFHSTLGYRCTTRKLSFEALIRMIRETHPSALFDDTLYNHPQAIRSFEKAYNRQGLAMIAESASRTKGGSTGGRMMTLAYLKYATALAGRD